MDSEAARAAVIPAAFLLLLLLVLAEVDAADWGTVGATASFWCCCCFSCCCNKRGNSCNACAMSSSSSLLFVERVGFLAAEGEELRIPSAGPSFSKLVAVVVVDVVGVASTVVLAAAWTAPTTDETKPCQENGEDFFFLFFLLLALNDAISSSCFSLSVVVGAVAVGFAVVGGLSHGIRNNAVDDEAFPLVAALVAFGRCDRLEFNPE